VIRARERVRGWLDLEDGTTFEGYLFGAGSCTDGEVVFNTGMVGYVEAMTDPSYRGQVLAFTYPLIGNYGVPDDGDGMFSFQSGNIQARGIVVQEYIEEHSHWRAKRSLGDWMNEEGITGIGGIDTRMLTKILRERGTMLGRIRDCPDPGPFQVEDPNSGDLVSEVATDGVIAHGENGAPHVVLVDCGAKNAMLEVLLREGARVTVVPYDHDFSTIRCDAYLISNGPGDPTRCKRTIDEVRVLLRDDIPVSGICLGCQIIALAAGGGTYKLKYGHRSQNQPVMEKNSGRCLITSQNHGYAVDPSTVPEGWVISHTNLNDGTVEGIAHEELPFFGVQYHPEACPGPKDPGNFFDRLMEVARHG